MSMVVFVAAAVFLLAVPLAGWFVWSAVRESRNRAELRERALQGPVREREAAGRVTSVADPGPGVTPRG